MRTTITIAEAVNGYRFDIVEDEPFKIHKENVVTLNEAFVLLQHYAEKQLKTKPPTMTMDVI